MKSGGALPVGGNRCPTALPDALQEQSRHLSLTLTRRRSRRSNASTAHIPQVRLISCSCPLFTLSFGRDLHPASLVAVSSCVPQAHHLPGTGWRGSD